MHHISEEMYMSKLYGNSLTDQEYERELAWLKEHHTKPEDYSRSAAGLYILT